MVSTRPLDMLPWGYLKKTGSVVTLKIQTFHIKLWMSTVTYKVQKFLAHTRCGFQREQFAVPERLVPCGSLESNPFTFHVQLTCLGLWRPVGLRPWLCTLSWSIFPYISLLAKKLLVFFPRKFCLFTRREKVMIWGFHHQAKKWNSRLTDPR